MKSYEVELSVSQWSKSGWVFLHDVVEVWNVEENEISEWIEDIKNDSPDLFDYVTDAFREWCITLVEISDGGSEKILAQTSIWESELAKEWFNN